MRTCIVIHQHKFGTSLYRVELLPEETAETVNPQAIVSRVNAVYPNQIEIEDEQAEEWITILPEETMETFFVD